MVHGDRYMLVAVDLSRLQVLMKYHSQKSLIFCECLGVTIVMQVSYWERQSAFGPFRSFIINRVKLAVGLTPAAVKKRQ